MRDELKKLRNSVIKKLKIFQRATVDRIDHIYRNKNHPQNRVLVADEVGLGKTLIAKGVIANLAVLRDEEGADLFKVIYVCSNQAIARQNIGKLRISEKNNIDNSVEETRLSMQHLRIMEQERYCRENNIFIQLTPLTPGTSFQITKGQGSVSERALIYCVLRRKIKNPALYEFLQCGVDEESWQQKCDDFKKRINSVKKTFPDYPECLFPSMDSSLLAELRQYLRKWNYQSSDRKLIAKLRGMFTKISAGKIQPDLVIMDEFQRFHSLLNPQDDELQAITDEFLRCGAEILNRPRILLLSATPYKLYSTLDEIDETNSDDHYKEFMEVIDFLLDHDSVRVEQFKSIWQQYSKQLCDLKRNIALTAGIKQSAENALYNSGMCRTERISFVKDGDFLVSLPALLNPGENDVLAYIELSRILAKLKLSDCVPYEFAKSSPYLLSFMDQYKLKQIIVKKLTSAKSKEIIRGRGNRSLVWMRRDAVDKYDMLPACHAKLECLRKYAFEHHAERLLWIPPSMPNYEPQGVFKEAGDFSKLLIFSAWEMVPRMIATLISYDAECRTNGKLCKERYKSLQKVGTRRGMKTLHYFNSSRFPQNRLFSLQVKNEHGKFDDRLAPQAEILRIVSSFLVNCFSPPPKQISLEEARSKVRTKIAARLDGLRFFYCPDETDTFTALGQYLDGTLPSGLLFTSKRDIPKDALSVLTDMALAAPGICVVRSLKRYFPEAAENEILRAANIIIDSLLKLFDSSIGIGAIAKSCNDLNKYERKVLQYCIDGNFQAMFDEYCFLQKLETDGNLSAAAANISNALNIHTATPDVPTWESTVHPKDESPLKIRSHYAVEFNKKTNERNDTESSKEADRKASIRTAFNSPFRPFVLASTSIGQEGLDFHLYCRRVMHWNLPHNPTELEQREGRINRYLCLAVRNSMARYFRSKPKSSAVHNWDDLLSRASKETEKNNYPYSEITPFWCFSKNQQVKIERIVPLYPFSRDKIAYDRLLKLLSLYRLTMGQARQEEILNAILTNNPDTDQLTKDLFISLCPFQKKYKKRPRKSKKSR